MKIFLFTTFTIFFFTFSQAQFLVGHRTVTFSDPTRSGGFGSGGGAGRQIQCEVYYPATSAGDNTPFVAGSFPIISFGHGFVMGWDSYDNFWNNLVPKGYIMIFPRTEGNISPNHGDFGLDLAQAVTYLQNQNTIIGSPFNGKVGQTAAIMGHSMGGGSSYLAAANNPSITTLINFAAANTNPSSISAAKNVKVPSLVIAGSNDCVAPPVDHQRIMYDSLASACKAYVSISGGTHCQFSSGNGNCSFGESTCSPPAGSPATISMANQHLRTFKYLTPWLNKYLKGECSSNSNFDSLLVASMTTEITYLQSCTAAAGSDKTICEGASTPIGTVAMAGYSYAWTSTPAGFTSTNATPTVAPTVSITYQLSFTNLLTSCIRFDQNTITVNPTPTANAGINSGACVGASVAIGQSPVANVTYSWSPTTNLSSSSLSNPSATNLVSGTTDYVLTAVGTNLCARKDTVSVTFSPNFSLTTSSDASVCSGTNVNLTSTISPFNPATVISSSVFPKAITDNTPANGFQTANTLPTIAQLNASTGFVSVNLTSNNYVLKGATISITHAYSSDVDIYLRSPNDVIFVLSTDNGGTSAAGYNNISFQDGSPIIPATLVTNATYAPEVGSFSGYSGPMTGLWRLYVIDDASTDVGNITAFKLNVLEIPTAITYSWTPTLGLSSSTTSSTSVSPVSTATYSLNATFLGCSQTDNTLITVLPSPIANAGLDVTVCSGGSTSIGANSVAGINYSWTSNPVGFTSTLSNPSINPSANTSYFLSVSDASSCIAKDTVLVQLTVPPVATITPSGNTSICSGSNVTLTAPAGYSIYNWSNGTTATNSIVVNSSGNYSVTMGNVANCTSTSSSILVSVNSALIPSIASSDIVLCPGETANLSVLNSPFTSFTWSNGLGTLATAQANQAGSYSLTTLDANGCSATSNALVITAPAVVNPVIQANDVTLCSGETATLSVQNGTYSNYLWSNGLGNTATANTQTAGNYSLSVIDVNGCSSTSNSLQITTFTSVIPLINASEDSICPGETTQLSVINGPYTSYQWSNNLGSGSNANVQNGGVYSVNVIDANGCNSSSLQQTIVSHSTVNPTITADNLNLCQGEIANLSVINGNYSTYFWTNNLGTSATTQTTNAGVYSLTTTDNNGCTTVSNSLNVTVFTPTVPTITTNNGVLTTASAPYIQWLLNGVEIQGANGTNYTPISNGTYTVISGNDENCSEVSNATIIDDLSIFQNEITGLTIFPNPMEDQSKIEIPSSLNENSTLIIMDASGRKIVEFTINDNEESILLDRKLFSSTGIYFIELTNANQHFTSKLIIK